MVRVCFVCLGNICRSPTAEAVMLGLLEEEGLGGKIEIESAGTSSYHVGERPDPRARRAAKDRGVELRGRAQQFGEEDFARFDYVIAMDRSNLDDLHDIAPDGAAREKTRLLRSYDPESPRGASVPDPYYGGTEGFQEVLDICDAGCRALLARIREEHGL